MAGNPDYVRPAFEEICLGYSTASIDQLRAMEGRLSKFSKPSPREYGILHAIQDAVAFPEEFEAMRKPFKFHNRPKEWR
jgi:hypothetical protein